MLEVRKGALVAVALTSMAAGAIGAWVFAPGFGSAATSTTTPNANGGSSGTFHSNEDPTHEKNESAQREAEENSGQFAPGGWMHGSNEDPTHEAGESPQREAEENQQNGSQSGGSGTGGASNQQAGYFGDGTP